MRPLLLSIFSVCLLCFVAVTPLPGSAADKPADPGKAETKELDKCMEAVAQRCHQRDKKSIHCMDELVKTINEAKKSGNKKKMTAALDTTLEALAKIKDDSKKSVCMMEVLEKSCHAMDEQVEQIKKDLSTGDTEKAKKGLKKLEELIEGSYGGESFMSGPYF